MMATEDYIISGKSKTMASDIETEHIIFRNTPPEYHPYIKLARLDRPIGAWLLLFPCWWSIVLSSGGVTEMTPKAWLYMALCLPGAFLMRAAGCVVNDIWDRELDAKVERTKTRPLASGAISLSKALVFLAALLGLSFLILILLPRPAILLGVLSLALVATYPYMKRITWLPQLFLGFTFNWGALLGGAAVTGAVTGQHLMVYTAGIFWTLGYDTIYAHQDKEDDALVGIKSTARLFSEQSRFYVAIFYALALVFLTMVKYETSPGLLTPMLISLPAILAFWMVKKWDMHDPESCLRMFRMNQWFGWLMLAMLAF
jgi:4-hydroxybenzoate polyprenyltransferase